MTSSFSTWQEGTYYDLWLVVHFLSGIFGGTGLLLIGTPEPIAWTLAFGIAIVWEIGEWRAGIPEDIQNKFIDVCVGVLGGALGYLYVRSLQLSFALILGLFTIETLLLIYCAATGWKKYFRSKFYATSAFNYFLIHYTHHEG